MNDPDNVCKRKMSNKLHNKSQKHTETAMGLYWSDKVLKNDLLKRSTDLERRRCGLRLREGKSPLQLPRQPTHQRQLQP